MSRWNEGPGHKLPRLYLGDLTPEQRDEVRRWARNKPQLKRAARAAKRDAQPPNPSPAEARHQERQQAQREAAQREARAEARVRGALRKIQKEPVRAPARAAGHRADPHPRPSPATGAGPGQGGASIEERTSDTRSTRSQPAGSPLRGDASAGAAAEGPATRKAGERPLTETGSPTPPPPAGGEAKPEKRHLPGPREGTEQGMAEDPDHPRTGIPPAPPPRP